MAFSNEINISIITSSAQLNNLGRFAKLLYVLMSLVCVYFMNVFISVYSLFECFDKHTIQLYEFCIIRYNPIVEIIDSFAITKKIILFTYNPFSATIILNA